jgi:hypothetical protein
VTDFDAVDLEARLVELGRSLELPAPPDLRAAVLARLAETASGRPRLGWSRYGLSRFGLLRFGLSRFGLSRYVRSGLLNRRVAAVAIAVLVLLGAFTPAGQAAVARVVHAFGVVLHVGALSAPARPERLPGETASALDPVTGTTSGQATRTVPPPEQATGTTLARARRQVRFPVLVPDGLGAPDRVSVSDGGRVLSLIYLAGSGRPSPGPGGISARLDEFDGTLEAVFFKQLSAGAEYMELPDGGPAVWIGAPHDVTYVDSGGHAHTDSAHLASHTMIWTVGAVTLRLEGDFTRDEALAIAAG